MSDLLEIKVGHTYRAKRPRPAGTIISPLVNDRTVTWFSRSHVQYDSPSVSFGRHYPTVTIEKFRAWASHDVTDELPRVSTPRGQLKGRHSMSVGIAIINRPTVAAINAGKSLSGCMRLGATIVA